MKKHARLAQSMSYRPTPEVQELLEMAKATGAEQSDFIRECILAAGPTIIDGMIAKRMEELERLKKTRRGGSHRSSASASSVRGKIYELVKERVTDLPSSRQKRLPQAPEPDRGQAS